MSRCPRGGRNIIASIHKTTQRARLSRHRLLLDYRSAMSSIEERHAELSCTPCKRLKRRCSKDLPTCSLCSKVGRKCVYPTQSTTPTRSEPPSELGTGGSRTRNGTPTPFSFRSTAPSNPFVQNPPSKLVFCFLDSIASRGSDAALPCDLQWRDVCPNSGEIINGRAMDIVRLYFDTTHLWLPIGKSTVDKRPSHFILMSSRSLEDEDHETSA